MLGKYIYFALTMSSSNINFLLTWFNILFIAFCILLQDLTEFNTAHNRRIATLPIDEANIVNPRKRRRSSANVSFSSEEFIINPGMELLYRQYSMKNICNGYGCVLLFYIRHIFTLFYLFFTFRKNLC